MNLRMFALVLSGAALVYAIGPVGAADKDEKKGAVVKIAGLSSTAPGDWKEEKPSGTMRLQQFLLPKADGDETDAEVTLYKAGGGAKANIDRWKNQFDLPKGKKETDVVKEQQMKVSDAEVSYLDITGTYKAPPFDPKYKGKKMENFRLIGVIFSTKDGEYQIRMIGPEKTIEKYKKGFDEFVKAFK
jgi:hypothetical protein